MRANPKLAATLNAPSAIPPSRESGPSPVQWTAKKFVAQIEYWSEQRGLAPSEFVLAGPDLGKIGIAVRGLKKDGTTMRHGFRARVPAGDAREILTEIARLMTARGLRQIESMA